MKRRKSWPIREVISSWQNHISRIEVSNNRKVHYDDISKSYDNHRSYSGDDIKEIIDFAGIKPDIRVLDLGCGTGNVARGLRGLIDVDTVGLDISLPMLSVAREKSLEVICADASNGRLPFREGSFDAIIGGYVIHQINNLENLFAECYRCLRRGVLAMLTSSHRQIENHHPVIKRFFPSLIDANKARFPDIPEIVRLLYSAGFTDIKYQETRVQRILLDDEYLKKVKGKYVSTYQLLPQNDFEAGVAKLETYIRNLKQPEIREWRGTLISGRRTA
jgi:ubiquinone/menaquinone biosynthesis C-methylase UbiE